MCRPATNIKVVAAVSWGLFERQPHEYRARILSETDREHSMVITNGALRWMTDWSSDAVHRRHSLSPERDDRWLTGGSVEEVMDEAGLSRDQIRAGIDTYVRDVRARGVACQP